jgi:hypothetical protein
MKLLVALLGVTLCSAAGVTTIRVPNGGIQPQIVERSGVIHLIYFSGDPSKGDIYYVKSLDYGRTFSKPLRVNSSPGSAMAVGNIRGAQLAVGAQGRVHVAWNGSTEAMLYGRLNDAGVAFEPSRNLIHAARGLDGGGSIAAGPDGRVYVFWHAPLPGLTGEQNRRVWIAASNDEGKTFAPERLAFDKPVGACGCCGMKAYADESGVYVLFRAADQVVNRDIWLLSSKDQGRTFQGSDISHWTIGACVMSSASLAASPDGILAAWETEKQAYFGRIENGRVATPIAAPGIAHNRKYPVVAANGRGDTLFAWSEDTAWKKGGSVAWVLYGKDGRPETAAGHAESFPVWDLLAAFARPDGTFVIVY